MHLPEASWLNDRESAFYHLKLLSLSDTQMHRIVPGDKFIMCMFFNTAKIILISHSLRSLSIFKNCSVMLVLQQPNYENLVAIFYVNF